MPALSGFRLLLALAVLVATSPLRVQAQVRATPAVRVAPGPMRVPAPSMRPMLVRPAPIPSMRQPSARGVPPGRIVPLAPVSRGRLPGLGSHHFANRHFRFFFGDLGRRCFFDPFFDPFFCRQFLFRHSFLPAFSPFFSVPVFTTFGSYPVAQEAAATTNEQQSELQSEIEQLRAEIDRLREEEDLRYRSQQERQAVPSKPSSTEENSDKPSPPAILLLRDGRRREVQNYAVVGETLWIFTEQRADKVPLSELDLGATRKANADRDIDFILPQSRR